MVVTIVIDRPTLSILNLHIIFQEYKKSEDPLSGPSHTNANYSTYLTFVQQFQSADVRVEREVWAYSTISFMADLGGLSVSLSGSSLLSAWDCLQYLPFTGEIETDQRSGEMCQLCCRVSINFWFIKYKNIFDLLRPQYTTSVKAGRALLQYEYDTAWFRIPSAERR